MVKNTGKRDVNREVVRATEFLLNSIVSTMAKHSEGINTKRGQTVLNGSQQDAKIILFFVDQDPL